MTNRQKPVTYRGYSIEQELSGSFSVYLLGYLAAFKTEAAARAYIDGKRG